MPRLSLRADAGVGAIAVSPTSRDAVLAGRSGLYIVDLHDPFALPRWLPLRSAWEVASVQWCPHPNRPACLVSSSNQKALVWNLALPSEKAIEHVLHGHRRAVTDVSFAPLNRDLMATSSIDTTVRLWDLRQVDAATMTFADFNAGMMQVHWDPTNEHQLATAQAARISIWDKRKANQPVAARVAHESECNGLEYFANGKIITCSTDRTIKVWDMRRSDGLPDVEIEADFPLWRALPTPYEYGAFVVPLRGGKNRVSLINLAGKSGKTRFGDVQLGYFEHEDKVKSAVYMRTDLSPAHYDLMTWSHDSQLREWKGDMLQKLPHASLGKGCKDDVPAQLPNSTVSFNTDEFDHRFHNLHGAGKEVFDLPILNRKSKDKAHTISQFDWIAGVHLSKAGLAHSPSQLSHKASEQRASEQAQRLEDTTSSQVFSQEIISVSARFPRVLFEDINIGARTCVLSLFGPWGHDADVINVSLDIKAPLQYPNQPLEFNVYHDLPYLSDARQAELSEALATSALKLSQHSMHALEFCVHFLVGDPVSIEDHLAKSGSEVPLELPDQPDEPREHAEDHSEEVSDALSESDGILVGSHHRDDSSSATGHALSSVSEPEEESADRLDSRAAEGDAIIDSTPLPKSCGGVWSVTGQLICFFNHKPVKKDRGPLPLDKVFADDSDSEGSNAPFVSDSDDFELHAPESIIKSTNWAVTAAQLNAAPEAAPKLHERTLSSSSSAHPSHYMQHMIATLNAKRSRAKTMTTATSDDNTVNNSAYPTHTVVIHNMLHLWPCRPDLAADYNLSRCGPPLEMAQHNARVAARYGLHLHVYVWKLLIQYIKSELESFEDQMYVVTSNQLKFEWSGASIGLSSFLPELAAHLESKGEIQLLVGISMILSSLRAQRQTIKQETVLKLNKDLNTLPIMESETETFFHAGNGQITLLGRPDDLIDPVADSSYWNQPRHRWPNKLYFSPRESSPDGTDSSWLGSTAIIDGTNDEPPQLQQPLYQHPQQQHQLQYQQLQQQQHLQHQHQQQQLHLQQQQLQQHQLQQHQLQPQQLQVPGTEPGFYFSFEITNSALFEFSYPHSNAGVYARPKSTVLQSFTEWLPRLKAHRAIYASLLHTWGLSMQRAEVSKPNTLDPLVSMTRFRFPQEASTVEISTNEAVCAFCSQTMTRLLVFCGYCNHAMHCACAEQWWSEADVCPAACGCACKRRIL